MQIESGERGERCRWQMKRPERVAAVGVQRSRSDGKAHTASPQQDTNTFPREIATGGKPSVAMTGKIGSGYLSVGHP